jgi:uncharacterized cofD-like protein
VEKIMPIILYIAAVLGWVAIIIAIYLLYKVKKERENIEDISIITKEQKGPKVVVIGGGTGQSIFLRGLKLFTQNITAIVTVADDGGGSGVLREDLGMLPPGDIRNCLLALANIEPTMQEIMQYRFTEGNLKGQSFGNLFLAAMNGIYGNFETAVYKMSEIFAITGRVLPVTLQNVDLIAKLNNGNVIKGESAIPVQSKKQHSHIDKVYLDPKDVKPLDEVINVIQDADIIVIGPGSLYTSIMPNLLVKGVVEAIKSTNAPKVYIANIMTQPGETDEYNVYEHIEAITKHVGENIIDIIISNNEILSEDILNIYRQDGARQVLLDVGQMEKLYKMGIMTIETSLVEVKKNYVRHDAQQISKIVIDLALSYASDDNIK